VDAQHHLFDAIPGLYEAGCSINTVHRAASNLFRRQGTVQVAAERFDGLIAARVAPHRNNARPITEETQRIVLYCISPVMN
jgi:hypothetical protein